MSMVFDSRDVSVGPTLGIDLTTSSPACVSGDADEPFSAGYMKRDGGGNAKRGFQPPIDELEKSETSSESSSIGVPSSSGDGDDDEGQEVESKFNGSLCSLDSLEESLPIKRGLSNHFTGKSKSFASLSDVDTVKEIEKQENPLNKRRRIMLANKWFKKSSFYSSKNPISMPLLALNEEEEQEQDNQKQEENDEEEEEEEEYKFHERRCQTKGLKSCFSLADLQK